MEDASTPLRGIFSKLFRQKNTEEENEFEEEIRDMVNEGQEQGAIHLQEAKMITNIFEFGDKEAKDIMSFRKNIAAIEASTSMEDALKYMLDEGFSRYPLYEEELDNIVGVLHLKDVMQCYLDKKELPLVDITREPFYVHDAQNINTLLKEMQTKKIHMAIVLDEYGQTEGIVAMEDILEVIVGKILDEYDDDDHDITHLGEKDCYLMQGLTRLDEVEELLNIEFPDEDIETLNGFLLYELGHLPEKDDDIEIEHEGYLFKPIDIHDKMIKQIKVSKVI